MLRYNTGHTAIVTTHATCVHATCKSMSAIIACTNVQWFTSMHLRPVIQLEKKCALQLMVTLEKRDVYSERVVSRAWAV